MPGGLNNHSANQTWTYDIASMDLLCEALSPWRVWRDSDFACRRGDAKKFYVFTGMMPASKC